MNVKAILFDLDDTIFQSYSVKWRQHQETARRFYDVVVSEDMLRQHWVTPTYQIVEILYGQSDTTEAMVAAYRSLDAEFPKKLHDRVLDVLRKLRKQGYFLGVVSNAQKVAVWKDFERLGLPTELFDSIKCFEDIGFYKPDPRAFDPTLQELKERGIVGGIVYVGDSLSDYEAATKAGIDFIGVTTGLTDERAFRGAGVKNIINALEILPSFIS